MGWPMAPAARIRRTESARRIAQRMGFEFEHRYTGYGELGQRLSALVATAEPAWQA